MTLVPPYLLSSHSSFLLLFNPQVSLFVCWSVFHSEGMEGDGISEGRLRWSRDPAEGQYCLTSIAMVPVGSLVFLYCC